MHKTLGFFLLFTILTLSSCSMVSVGYDFGDWLLKKRVLKFVKFYSPQQEKLEIILDEFMAWHKKNALELYEQDVLAVKKRFENSSTSPIEAKELSVYLMKFRSRYFESFSYLTTSMIPLLSILNSDQIERTKVLLGRKLDAKREENKILKSELKKQLESKWLENLEDWFGVLTSDQKLLIKNKAESTFIDPLIVWSRNGKRTNTFINIFDQKVTEKREAALKRFFQDWQDDDFYSSWRMDASLILAEFMKSLSSKQRKHALEKLNDILKILKNLQD